MYTCMHAYIHTNIHMNIHVHKHQNNAWLGKCLFVASCWVEGFFTVMLDLRPWVQDLRLMSLMCFVLVFYVSFLAVLWS